MAELNRESRMHSLHVQNHRIQLYQSLLQASVVLENPNAIGDKTIGSGFFIDSSGRILTCRHVVAGLTQVELQHAGKEQRWKARVLSENAELDIALLELEAPGGLRPLGTVQELLLEGQADDDGETGKVSGGEPEDDGEAAEAPLEFAYLPTSPESRVLQSGAMFAAVGAPNGQRFTLISGYIGHSLRIGADPAQGKRPYIQLSESVFPGSSGGPVINARGDLIGMMRFTLTPYGRGTEGPGFAIPLNAIYNFQNTSQELVADKVEAMRGIVEIPITTHFLIRKLNLPPDGGAIVSYVMDDSPASSAGLQRYDYIQKADGEAVRSPDEFVRRMHDLKDAPVVRITFLRDGKEQSVEVSQWPEGAPVNTTGREPGSDG